MSAVFNSLENCAYAGGSSAMSADDSCPIIRRASFRWTIYYNNHGEHFYDSIPKSAGNLNLQKSTLEKKLADFSPYS
jgi:hypothetical protein